MRSTVIYDLDFFMFQIRGGNASRHLSTILLAIRFFFSSRFMQVEVFWFVKPCSHTVGYQRFG